MKKIDENLLRKIGETGTNNASKALSTMIGRTVEIFNISAKFIGIEQIPKFYGPEEVVTSVYLPITGDINGCSLFVFDKDSARELGDLLVQKAEETEPSAEVYDSALKEIGNIMLGSFLNATADLLDVQLVKGVPTISTNMMGAITNQIISEFEITTKQVLAIQIGFILRAVEVTAYLFKLFETGEEGSS